jgi:hypothetical protein
VGNEYFGANTYLLGIDQFEFEKFYQGSSMIIADYYTRWKYPVPGMRTLVGYLTYYFRKLSDEVDGIGVQKSRNTAG